MMMIKSQTKLSTQIWELLPVTLKVFNKAP